ncbi:MAG TPA: VWA domain-containing protein [Candidatus Acidoferrum sp.]|nr:VWA domain-containing protein [Candidatus Acidoferrum sp.]
MQPFTGSTYTRGTAIAALLLVPSALAAQSPPQSPQIRVATHLVQIGVIVRDSNGPVTDLTKDDFILSDRGKLQEIAVFQRESLRLADTGPQSPQTLPPNTFSDLPQYAPIRSGPLTIILLDNLNTLIGSAGVPYEDTPYWMEDLALANAKQHLLEFLKQLDPDDRIAVYGLSDSLRVLCDFTCGRDQLVAVVRKYDATSKTQREVAAPGVVHIPNAEELSVHMDADRLGLAGISNLDRAQTTMAALNAIAKRVADIPGRKDLLWLTANLPFSGEAIARILDPSNIAAYPIDARGLLARQPFVSGADSDDFIAYTRGAVLPLPAQYAKPIGTDTMEEMADDTGGKAFVNTNDLTGAIRKVVRDSAVTYTIGFYIEADSLDGKFHSLKVHVKRKGLSVRYPRGYFAFQDPPAPKDDNRNNLLSAIRVPAQSSAIPLQVRIDRLDRHQLHSLQIFGSVDLGSLRLVQNGSLRTGNCDVYVIEQDIAGVVVHQANNRLHLRLTERQFQSYLRSGISFRESLEPRPETAVLRVLVQDPSTSQTGSVIIPLAQVK